MFSKVRLLAYIRLLIYKLYYLLLLIFIIITLVLFIE
jgi:hypothetical protein